MAHARKSMKTLEFQIGNDELIVTNSVAYITAHGGDPKNQKTVDACKALMQEVLLGLAEMRAALMLVKERRAKKLAAEADAVWADRRAPKVTSGA